MDNNNSRPIFTIFDKNNAPMNQLNFQNTYQKEPSSSTSLPKKDFNLSQYLKTNILSFIPILQWLPNYNLKENIHGDIIAGLTCGIMHIPQGMAYAILSNSSPIVGLYSSFFACIFYMIFGTSRHISIGVFAVVSMMVGATKLRIINEDKIFINVNGTDVLQPQIDDASLLSTITLTVGLIQFTIGLLKLGFLTNYMSDSLLSGFTTGAACHVFVSQINKVLGYKVPGSADTGVGILIFMLKEILIRINQTNLMTLGMSFISILVLSLGRDYLNPWVKKFTKIPVPLELILVVVSTAASMFFNLKSTFNVPVVNHIPQGFPMPKLLPDFKLIPRVFTDCLGIAVVCYMFVISMGKLFAKKHKYNIDATQELYACGLMSMFSCFFNVYPTGASLSRSSVCEMSGVKTQLNVIFSSSLLFVVIMWLGKYLEPLPMCILASIVIVSLKSLFMQFQELPRLWRISKYDFAVWLISFGATAFVNVTIGLGISLGFILLTVVMQEQFPKTFELGTDGERRYFKPVDVYTSLKKVSGNVTIFKFESPLHFANCATFSEKVTELFAEVGMEMTGTKIGDKNMELKESLLTPFNHYFILDCAAITYIDSMGLDTLRKLYDESKSNKVCFILADVTETVLTLYEKCQDLEIVPWKNIFPTINDAINSIEN